MQTYRLGSRLEGWNPRSSLMISDCTSYQFQLELLGMIKQGSIGVCLQPHVKLTIGFNVLAMS